MLKKTVAFFVAASLFSAPAIAQSPQLGAGQLFANPTATQRPGVATNFSPFIDRAFNGNQGSVFNRGPTVWAATRTPVLGLIGTASGTLGFAGLTSGTMTISPQSVAGTGTLLLPNLAGTIVAGASGPLVANATTGVMSCPTCVTSSGGGAISGTAPIVVSGAGNISVTASALTKTDDTNVTLTLGGTPGSALIAPASLTLGWAGQLGVGRGGTGLASGTSGGILGYTAAGTLASSVALTQNAIIIGGGAGATPTPLASLGTVSTVLHGNAAGAPSFGAVSLASDVSGILPLANGGTAANLTASNGGIFYSTSSAGAILAGTATAGQMLRSGAAVAPSWSTATWPATTTINQLLYSSAGNVVAGLATANGGILNTSSGGVPSVTPTPVLGVNGGTGGQLTINGATSGSAVVKVAAAAGTTNFQLPAGNGTSGYLLSTDGLGNTSWIAAGGTGTVTSITAGTGLSSSPNPIIATGTISLSAARQTLPTKQVFTSGSGTYTTPANVLYIRIRIVGGGGGGGGGGNGTPGTTGGNTTFGAALMAANGGAGGVNQGSVGSSANGGSASGGNVANIKGADGGGSLVSSTAALATGGNGGSSCLGGSGGGYYGAAGLAAATNSGSGGGGGGIVSFVAAVSGSGGGSGGCSESVITSPSATYAYAVGTGGAAAAAGANGAAGGAGAAGQIIVEEYYN